MSRFNEGDSESHYGFLWPARVRQVIEGKRGQRVMRELAEALLALPERRLIAGNIATAQGEVCAIGAYAKAKGVDLNRDLASVDGKDLAGWEGSDSDTAELGELLGMTHTLAWEIGFKNDVEFDDRRVIIDSDLVPMTLWTEYSDFTGKPEVVYARTLGTIRCQRGYTPEQRWEAMYAWAISKVEKWHLPAVVTQ